MDNLYRHGPYRDFLYFCDRQRQAAVLGYRLYKTRCERHGSWDIAFIKPGVNDMDTLWAYQENLMTDSLESRLFYRSCQPSVEPLRLSGRGRIVW